MATSTTLIILLSAAVVVLVGLVGLLVLHAIKKEKELRRKNEVIIREVTRNHRIIDRAVRLGLDRAALL